MEMVGVFSLKWYDRKVAVGVRQCESMRLGRRRALVSQTLCWGKHRRDAKDAQVGVGTVIPVGRGRRRAPTTAAARRGRLQRSDRLSAPALSHIGPDVGRLPADSTRVRARMRSGVARCQPDSAA